MTEKLMALILIVFSLVGLAVPSGVGLQSAVAESSGDGDASPEQEVDNESSTNQDSSSDDNVLENENEFGDDDAIVDQDNEADEDAVNLGVQDQDATQDIDQEQDAVNTNVDFDVQVAQQVEPPPPEEPPTSPPPPPEEGGVWCYTTAGVESETGLILVADLCFDTQSECEEFRATDPFVLSECERFDEPPPGCEPSTLFAEADCEVIREA